jgi:hypothetical protein
MAFKFRHISEAIINHRGIYKLLVGEMESCRRWEFVELCIGGISSWCDSYFLRSELTWNSHPWYYTTNTQIIRPTGENAASIRRTTTTTAWVLWGPARLSFAIHAPTLVSAYVSK